MCVVLHCRLGHVWSCTAGWVMCGPALQVGSCVVLHCRLGHVWCCTAGWVMCGAALQVGSCVVLHCRLGHVWCCTAGSKGIQRMNALVKGLILRRMKTDLGLDGKQLVRILVSNRIA